MPSRLPQGLERMAEMGHDVSQPPRALGFTSVPKPVGVDFCSAEYL